MFSEGDSWATQTERSDSGTRIVTMGEAFASVANGRPFIAKIDIEGFESDLFEKNLAWLDSVRAVFVPRPGIRAAATGRRSCRETRIRAASRR